MRPSIVAVLATLMLSVAAAADARQDTPAAGSTQATASNEQKKPLRIHSGIGGIIGAPVGDFHDNVQIAGGVTGHFGISLGDSPISLGVEASYLAYGGEDRMLPVGGLPDLTVRVSTSNDVYLFHGRTRAEKRAGRVRPYVDGLVGFSYLTTTTGVDAKEYCSSLDGSYSCSDNGDSITNLDDLVFSAGIGGGVMIGLGKSGSVRLDLSLRYLYGAQAAYLTEGGIHWADTGPPILDPHRSRTDMLLISIGITVGR
jgi:hypothetical protein